MIYERAQSRFMYDITVLQGNRTQAEQAKLVRSGASKTMKSRHLEEAAIDIGLILDGVYRQDFSLYLSVAEAMRKAALELGIELEWGGAWRHKLTDYTSAEAAYKAYVDRKRKAGGKPFLDIGHYNLTYDQFPSSFGVEATYYKPDTLFTPPKVTPQFNVPLNQSKNEPQIVYKEDISYFLTDGKYPPKVEPMRGMLPTSQPIGHVATEKGNIPVFNLTSVVESIPVTNLAPSMKAEKFKQGAMDTGIYGMVAAGLLSLISVLIDSPIVENLSVGESGGLTAIGVILAIARQMLKVRKQI